jgi:hypothetical protein
MLKMIIVVEYTSEYQEAVVCIEAESKEQAVAKLFAHPILSRYAHLGSDYAYTVDEWTKMKREEFEKDSTSKRE